MLAVIACTSLCAEESSADTVTTEDGVTYYLTDADLMATVLGCKGESVAIASSVTYEGTRTP